MEDDFASDIILFWQGPGSYSEILPGVWSKPTYVNPDARPSPTPYMITTQLRRPFEVLRFYIGIRALHFDIREAA